MTAPKAGHACTTLHVGRVTGSFHGSLKATQPAEM